jgi:ABC-type transport system substrate-binding protein
MTFHNGEKLDAQVLKDNWDFFTASPLTKQIFEQITSTQVVGPLQMKANLKGRWVDFPEAWTTQIGVVMAPASLTATAAERANHPIGTGAFKFKSWTPDKSLVVVRNPHYWQKGLPYLNEIDFRPITDPTSRKQALLAHDVDAAYLEDTTEVATLRNNTNFVVWQDPSAETGESLVMLNTMKAPLDDVRVRQALAYATDKRTMNQVINGGAEELANGPYRPSSPWYASSNYPQYDLAKAKALVKEYGAEHGPIRIVLESGVTGAKGSQTAQLLQEQWKQAGIDVTIGTTEIASLIVKVVQGNYQAVVWRQFDSPHPLQETVWWHKDEAPPIGTIGLNFARNRDAVLSAALDKARVVTTTAAQKAQYAIVQERLGVDVPYVWLSHIEPTVVARKGVENVLDAPIPDSDAQMMAFMNSAHTLAQVWLDPSR